MPSTSGSSDDTMTIAIPSAASDDISRCTSALVPTSMPRVGSSTISSFGAIDNHFASTTFCWLPPDSVPTLSPRRWYFSCSRALARLGLLFGGSERREARSWTQQLHTKLGRLSDPVGTLSGGNQQKVVLAKWLSTRPRLLIVDEPTRGIDVGTKAEVHRLMSSLAADGVAIVMVSSELPEVLGMADRIVVLREGRIAAELTRAEATEETVMYAAMGQQVMAS